MRTIKYFDMGRVRGRKPNELVSVEMQDLEIRTFRWDVPNVPNGHKAGCWVDTGRAGLPG